MKRNKMLLIVVCLGLMQLSGCWNSRELNTLAIVSALGIDQGAGDNQYRLSFQVINPSTVSSGQTGGTGGNRAPVTIVTETGNSLFEIIRKASVKAPRRLFFAHTRIIVFGEAAARRGVKQQLDYLTRNNEMRLTPQLFIARGTSAESILRTVTPIEKIPANTVRGEIKMAERTWSEVAKTDIDDAIESFQGEGSEPTIPGIETIGDSKNSDKIDSAQQTDPKSNTALKGLAMFKEGKMVRWLDGPDARGTLWLKNKIRATAVALDCERIKNGLAVEIIRSKTKLKADIKHGQPSFQIDVEVMSHVREVQCQLDISDPKVLEQLNTRLEDKIKAELHAALNAALEQKSDIFGFGELIGRKYPKQWATMKNDWDDRFAKSEFNIHVTVSTRESGMQIQPFLLPEKNNSRS
ncbi:Ger(x)C family spore germination protein [Paenibacillus beijingensis]|nr:Ger(x)C family spore germination protein [Paenibacillus beijingensis]